MSAFTTNPLLHDWGSKNYGLPPFEQIKPNLFEEALKVSMDSQLKEVEEIVNNPVSPSFDNTMAALDRCGSLFNRVNECFSNLCSSVGVAELQEVELKMAAPLAAHYNRIANYPGLFERLDKVHQERYTLGLDDVQIRLVERFHLDAVRAGARFSVEDKAKYEKIVEELAGLQTKFTQNVMADEAEIFLELNEESDLSGLPTDLVTAAKQAGKERGLEKPIVTLSRSLVEPFLTFSDRRDLREKAWKLWTKRGELDSNRQNLLIAKRILELREQQAKIHGYQSFAAFNTADTMAGSPLKVQALLEDVWNRAKQSVAKERSELEQFIQSSDSPISKIEPWDWRYYAEKVRMRSYESDNSEVKPFFPLPNMVQAIFDTANQLFGLQFNLRADLPAYHPDVQVYEVVKDNELVAIFLHDNYARPHKRSGAWMSELRGQSYEDGKRTIPIVLNNNNFNKPPEGGVSLLSFDDAKTLFHEFGHGLHGMLSNVRYRRLASTNVLKDFVELPSQLYEHWLSEEKVLQKHARHYLTHEPIPADLLKRLFAAKSFGQAFQTIEFTSSALLDARLHQVPYSAELDLSQWEASQLQELGMPDGIIMRHRLPHFQHMFSSEFYAAGYYVYLWAEVLDADAFDAFKETGDCFNIQVAQRVYNNIYSAGNSKDPAQLFRDFRGRDPVVEPMLKGRGLILL